MSAWLAITAIHRVTLGEFCPTQAGIDRWLHLGASGLLAYVVSSYFMLNAYQHIGPRLTMRVASFTLSHTTAIVLIPIGYFVFHEHIPLQAILGTLVTMIGIGSLFS